MPKPVVMRGYLWARTLWLLLAVALYWVGRVNWDAFLYGTVFVLAPWAVLLTALGAARGQVQWNAYSILLFAMAGCYILAALRNRNLSPRGLLVLALGFATAFGAGRILGKNGAGTRRRGLLIAGLCVAAAALAVLLLMVIRKFFGWTGWLPWAARRTARHASANGTMLARSRRLTLKGLTVLTYACGAMLVAGIVPEGADAAHLRRESRALGVFTVALTLVCLAPAVVSVFLGRPIEAAWLPSKIGIQTPGLISDRIWALQHPNRSAMCAVVGVFCAAYCLHGRPRRGMRASMIIAAVVFVMALAHCQSRASDISLGLGVGAVAYRWVGLRSASRGRRVGAGLAAGALALILTILLISGVFTADVFVASRMNASAESSLTDVMRENRESAAASRIQDTTPSDNPLEVAEGVVLSRTVSAGLLDVFSNGRDLIWREALDYLIHNPGDMIFGMGSGDILERMRAYQPDRYFANHLHNGLLEALARGGVFMLACVLAWLVLLMKPAARVLAAADGSDPGAYLFPALIGALLAASMVEAMLFTDASVCNLLFFCAAGRVARADRQGR